MNISAADDGSAAGSLLLHTWQQERSDEELDAFVTRRIEMLDGLEEFVV